MLAEAQVVELGGYVGGVVMLAPGDGQRGRGHAMEQAIEQGVREALGPVRPDVDEVQSREDKFEYETVMCVLKFLVCGGAVLSLFKCFRAQGGGVLTWVLIRVCRKIYIQLYTVFLAGKSPDTRSFTVYTYGSGQPYL